MDDLPKAKRLRGHFLELEKRKGNTLTKGQAKSGLVNKLLSLWAHGQLSATLCQQIAHLALLDGAQSEELSLWHPWATGAKPVAIAIGISCHTSTKRMA